MTKQHYKLIGKLWAGLTLLNADSGFDPEDVLKNTTEDQLDIIVQECNNQGEKLLKLHPGVRRMGSIEQVAKYVENLYYE